MVRVNSLGGSVLASDEIYHALLAFGKPAIVWMGEMTVSGGYYITCGGDYIFAYPDTLTGSIGVITSDPYKDIGTSFREMTEGEQGLQGRVN